MKRREFVQLGLATPAIPLVSQISTTSLSSSTSDIKHSICQWCYSNTPLELLADKAKSLGIHSIELLHVDQWQTVQSRGLNVAVGYANDWGLTRGFNRPEDHTQLVKQYTNAIEKAHEYGVPQIICFSGNRNGLTDEEGLENCAKGLEPVVKHAEKYGITITMELLNSKIDHKDYQCDSTQWGRALVDKLGSDHFKLLYDIYHMQIMEGDVIRTIRDNISYISHFHTGGVPGRNEIDETQELNYSAIVKAIRDAGFDGYVAQEFIPSWNKPFDALARAIDICTV